MVFETKEMRVGFFPPSDRSWMGGVNYYCNLFSALTKCSNNHIACFVFLGTRVSNELVELYKINGAIVVRDSVLDRFSFKWIIEIIFRKIFGRRVILDATLKKYNVALTSHVLLNMNLSLPQVGWLPDFQHIHLPDMFSEKERRSRNKLFMSVAETSEAVFLSSYDALKDFSQFCPDFAHKGRVAQFVSQPPLFYFELNDADREELVEKYKIDRPYIYVPNQFWRHKNHQLLLEAIVLSKNEGVNPLLVCSGLMEDYRDKFYVENLLKYVNEHELSENIKFLGVIPYTDVFSLIKFSVLVLNPSKFEGWSSTVEECKGVGKMMLLSNINVHKEQYPNAIFFDVTSSQSLSSMLSKLYSDGEVLGHDQDISLELRTKSYAEACIKVYSAIYSDL